MDVTFDPSKNVTNIRKHGISLERAGDFDFDSAMYKQDRSEDYGEVRFQAVGWLDALLYYLVFTEANPGIRAISLRKATRQEQKYYVEGT